jgi:hypothetical protein
MGMLLATSLTLEKQKSHTGFQWASCLNNGHVSGLPHDRVVDYFTENTINGKVSKSSNCPLSQRLKIL